MRKGQPGEARCRSVTRTVDEAEGLLCSRVIPAQWLATPCATPSGPGSRCVHRHATPSPCMPSHHIYLTMLSGDLRCVVVSVFVYGPSICPLRADARVIVDVDKDDSGHTACLSHRLISPGVRGPTRADAREAIETTSPPPVDALRNRDHVQRGVHARCTRSRAVTQRRPHNLAGTGGGAGEHGPVILRHDPDDGWYMTHQLSVISARQSAGTFSSLRVCIRWAPFQAYITDESGKPCHMTGQRIRSPGV